MITNTRATNQYYGKYRECCVVANLNKSPVDYKENYIFTEEEKEQMFSEGAVIASYLGDHQATYLGDKTALESGDLLLDGRETVEIKCVSNGNGTYYNTSIYYFEKFGFDFRQYMNRYGLYEALEKNFGSSIKISRTNKSPVNQSSSSYIRHNQEEIYNEKILPIDGVTRENFTLDVANYFTNHLDSLYEFISDMLEKNSKTSKKNPPDRLIVYNYKKKKIKEINLEKFKNSSCGITLTNKGLIIGNIRIIFGWQNGNGLNNPTIRVFLED